MDAGSAKHPANPLARLLAFLFYTGSAGGLICVASRCSPCLYCCSARHSMVLVPSMVPFGFPDAPEPTENFTVVAGYFLAYCFTAARSADERAGRAPTVVLPLVSVIMGVALLLGPYLLEFFISDPRRFSLLPWYLFGSPMVLSTSNRQAIAAAETVVTAWVILSGIATAPGSSASG